MATPNRRRFAITRTGFVVRGHLLLHPVPLRETSLLALIGVVLGVLVAAGMTRFIESMLFGLKALDPVTIAEAVLVMP